MQSSQQRRVILAKWIVLLVLPEALADVVTRQPVDEITNFAFPHAERPDGRMSGPAGIPACRNARIAVNVAWSSAVRLARISSTGSKGYLSRSGSFDRGSMLMVSTRLAASPVTFGCLPVTMRSGRQFVFTMLLAPEAQIGGAFC